MGRLPVLIAAACTCLVTACSPSGPPLHVSAVDLYAAYVKNAAAADQQYSNHRLIVDGISGGIDSEPGGYVLTIVPGVRAHLASSTDGVDLLKTVAVQCDSVAFVDGALDLHRCNVLQSTAADKSSETVTKSGADVTPPASPISPSDRLSAAFEAATAHREPYSIDGPDGALTVKPVRIIDVPFGAVLLTERGMEDGCHACQGYIGITYLSEQNGTFRVQKDWQKAIEGSGWGAPPPKWYMTENFTAYPAIYAEDGYMYQGESGKGATLTELRPSGPVTSETIDLGNSNDGAFESSHDALCNYTGKIENVVKGKSFDVLITGSAKGLDHYIERNGKFVRTTTAPRGLGCGS